MPPLSADAGQLLGSLVVAAVLFVVVVAVCAFLLALFQRVLPGVPSPPASDLPEGGEAAGGEPGEEGTGGHPVGGGPAELPPPPSGDLRDRDV